MSTGRITVIGGGIIGLSIAAVLQRDGLQVTLLEAKHLGAGASYGNAGHLATEQVYPVADPAVFKHLPRMLLDPLGPLRIDWHYLPKLLPWMGRMALNMRPAAFERIHQALMQLNRACLPAWANLVDGFGLQQWVHVQGSLLVCEKDASLQALQNHGLKLNGLGVENTLLDGAALQEREPALANNQIGGLFFPDTGHVTDLMAVMNKLAAEFQAAGGEIIENCAVLHAKQQGTQVVLHTSQGEKHADKVVVAMGAHAKALVEELTGVSVPLDTERGYHYMLPQEQGRLSIPVSSADRRFIMTPMDGGLRLAGTVEYAGLQAAPNMERARNLLQLANPMLKHHLNAAEAGEWMGFRPTIADSLPVIDRFGSVFLAFGHQHLGLTHAAITAELMRSLFANAAPSMDLRPYRLNRF
ncbi:FAD-binding oxidoreductase [Vitreoscilla massiliensis]|uniref:FAD-binding oxidoreductase n=1 Tax=Vitreoscilla massiliensis TaxID=1689272 RepID=A0ABY4E327_9NEIS|nr:FAD-dependent oxidoreductase [Vitreoscilla massiliensis]UOO88713.1 FAD-binding oxidoreductase [Vitreoscilla massiliensis]